MNKQGSLFIVVIGHGEMKQPLFEVYSLPCQSEKDTESFRGSWICNGMVYHGSDTHFFSS